MFIALIVLALAAGAATGVYRARQQTIAATAAKPAVTDEPASNASKSTTDTTNTTDTGAPVSLPTYTAAKYNAASTVEALSVNAVNAFLTGQNTNDAAAVASLYAESVDVGTVPVLVAGMQNRPVSVVFTSVTARADGSALINTTEKRQNAAGKTVEVKRIFELVPRENDYAVASYLAEGSSDFASGFAD